MVHIKTEGLTFIYAGSESKTLDNIDIEINKGELVLLMGKSGSGKTTLLRLLKKELAPFGSLNGSLENGFNDISFVVQNPQSSFVCDCVRSELVFALENKGLSNEKIAVALGETASFFNLNNMLDCKLSELSGGEMAVVSIAAAMINGSDLLILDEPFSQLDTKAVSEVISLIERLNKELGITIIVSSHTSEGIIDKCDRLIILEKGRAIANDKPDVLSHNDLLLPFYPPYTALFDSRPLTVKSACEYNKSFKEKAIVSDSFKDKAVVLKHITFAYGKRERDILENLDFVAYKGSIHSIIGANGSGKTTLLKIIAGIKKAYSARVRVNGRVAYLPQNPQYLFTRDTVLEEAGESFAKSLCPYDYETRHPYDLSGGEAQLLAMEILLRQSFDILLLDEPVKSLDFFAKQKIKEKIKQLKALGKTIIIVSHDIDFAGDISDFVSFLSDGIITITGGRREVLSSLNYYTTSIRRVTRAYLSSAVSAEDIE